MPTFTLIVRELRNSKCDDSKTKLGPNSRTEMARKKTFKKGLYCKKKKYQNSISDKTQIATKLNLNSNKTQIVINSKIQFYNSNSDNSIFGKT